jgi:outer membrane usher protein FimD/PapC
VEFVVSHLIAIIQFKIRISIKIGLPVLLLFFLFGLFSSGLAAQAAKDNQAPPGFQNVESKPLKVLARVFFLDKKVTETMVKYFRSQNKIRILNPDAVVKALFNIKDPEIVKKNLQGKLDAHTNKVCKGDKKKKGCGVIDPKVAGVIFNGQTFKLKLFVNQKYLISSVKDTGKPIKLKSSSVGLSYLQSFTGSASGSTNTNNQGLATGLSNINLRSRSVLGYQNARLQTRLNASKTGQSQSVQFTDLALNMDKWHKTFAAGYISAQGTNILQQQSVFGLSLSSNYDTYINFNKLRSTSVDVFLSTPSTVSVFKDGRLIYSTQLQAGFQSLSTNSFPQGSYDIKIEITDQSGQTKTQKQFFVKSPRLPNYGYPNFEVALGVLAGQGIASGYFPAIGNDPYVSLSSDKRIRDNLALQGKLEGTINDLFVGSLALTYLRSNFNATFETLLGTNGGYGGAFTLNTNYQGLNTQLTLRTRRKKGANQTDDDQNEEQNGLTPFASPDTQLQLNTSYRYGIADVNFSLNFSQAESNLSFGPTLRLTPDWLAQGLMNFEFSAVKSRNDTQIRAGIQIDFNAMGASFSANPGLQYRRDDTGKNLERNWQLNAQKNIAHKQGNTNINAGISKQSGRYNANTRIETTHNWGQLSFSTTHNNLAETFSDIQYTANFQSNISYNKGHFDLGGSERGLTGVMVDVSSPTTNDQALFAVMANGQELGKIGLNERQTFILSPYQTYTFKIKPVSGGIGQPGETKSATVYPGNVVYKHWQIEQKIVLLTRVVNPDGKAVASATLENYDGFARTSKTGLLQAEIPQTKQLLTLAKQDGTECRIDLSNYDYTVKNKIIDIQKVVCQPQNG